MYSPEAWPSCFGVARNGGNTVINKDLDSLIVHDGEIGEQHIAPSEMVRDDRQVHLEVPGACARNQRIRNDLAAKSLDVLCPRSDANVTG